MKKLLVSLLALIGVLCFASATLADGFTLSVDYGKMIWNYLPDFATVTLSGELDADQLLLGGSYSSAISYDPEPLPLINLSQSLWFAYGGLYLVDDEAFRLAFVGGYTTWANDYDDVMGGDYEYIDLTSIGVGFKAVAKAGPVRASLLYLYGVSNEFHVDYWDGAPDTFETDDFDFSLLDFKCAFLFTEAAAVYFSYRWVKIEEVGEPLSTHGFGFGVEVTF